MNRRWMINGPTACLLALATLLVGGCSGMGPREPIDVKASYLGLDNRSVAVLVSMPDHAKFNHPKAQQLLTEEITRRIMLKVPGVNAIDPRKIAEWQKMDENRHWLARPPSALIRHFKVDRLVLVEVGEYRTHDPGDKYVLRGVISATVNIVEAEAADPDNYAASYQKNVMYPSPRESTVGRVAVDEAKVEFVTQVRFCEETAGLFFDHKLIR